MLPSQQRNLLNVRDALRRQGEVASDFLSTDSNLATPNTRANHTLELELGPAVGKSIALTTKREDNIGAIQDATEPIMREAADSFITLPFAQARDSLPGIVLRHIDDVVQATGLGEVNVARVLGVVNMPDMMRIVDQYLPSEGHKISTVSDMQHVLQSSTQIRPDDESKPLIDSLHLIPKDKTSLSEKDIKFLEILLQLQDAAHSFVALNQSDPNRAFDPQRLDVYPLSISSYFSQLDTRDTEEAKVLTAFNLLKNCRASDGASLAPLLSTARR